MSVVDPKAPMSGIAGIMAMKGRDGDTMLAHINPMEAKMLKAMGGRGSANPHTGLLEFADAGETDSGSDSADTSSNSDSSSNSESGSLASGPGSYGDPSFGGGGGYGGGDGGGGDGGLNGGGGGNLDGGVGTDSLGTTNNSFGGLSADAISSLSPSAKAAVMSAITEAARTDTPVEGYDPDDPNTDNSLTQDNSKPGSMNAAIAAGASPEQSGLQSALSFGLPGDFFSLRGDINAKQYGSNVGSYRYSAPSLGEIAGGLVGTALPWASPIIGGLAGKLGSWAGGNLQRGGLSGLTRAASTAVNQAISSYQNGAINAGSAISNGLPSALNNNNINPNNNPNSYGSDGDSSYSPPEIVQPTQTPEVMEPLAVQTSVTDTPYRPRTEEEIMAQMRNREKEKAIMARYQQSAPNTPVRIAKGGGVQQAYEDTGGDYSEFSGIVKGSGDGMSDEVPFKVTGEGGPDMALLSNDEYVVDAHTMAAIGNGSPDAGAAKMDKWREGVRKKAYGNTKQPKQLDGLAELARMKI